MATNSWFFYVVSIGGQQHQRALRGRPRNGEPPRETPPTRASAPKLFFCFWPHRRVQLAVRRISGHTRSSARGFSSTPPPYFPPTDAAARISPLALLPPLLTAAAIIIFSPPDGCAEQAGREGFGLCTLYPQRYLLRVAISPIFSSLPSFSCKMKWDFLGFWACGLPRKCALLILHTEGHHILSP